VVQALGTLGAEGPDMRRPLRLVLTTRVFAGVATPVIAATASAGITPLKAGDERFWRGPFIESAHVEDAHLCDIAAACPEFDLPLRVGAARLRVGIDSPVRTNTYTVEVTDPDGVMRGSAQNSNQFDDEVFVADPQAGLWKVRVIPNDVKLGSFRMRAKLERTVPAPPRGRVPMLPNLKAVPPHEFTFTAPANPLNGAYPPDTVNPPLDILGVHPLSCTADEAAPVAAGGAGAIRCLRLTSGPINTGAGPFDLRFTFAQDMASGDADPHYLRGPIRQAVHNSDGSVDFRSAGTYIFHTTHAHFHDENILSYDLFRVTDAQRGGLQPTGGGVKSGFCPADQLFGEWEKFVQQPSGSFGEGDSAAGGNCFSVNDGFIGLSAGWGDVYRWQRPGQYVEFDGNGDGLYVVRTTVDKANHILESNDRDNSAYALIQVAGENVRILERGQGTDPWDRNKVVFAGDGPASRTR
jgi:hypothetical protein